MPSLTTRSRNICAQCVGDDMRAGERASVARVRVDLLIMAVDMLVQ